MLDRHKFSKYDFPWINAIARGSIATNSKYEFTYLRQIYCIGSLSAYNY